MLDKEQWGVVIEVGKLLLAFFGGLWAVRKWIDQRQKSRAEHDAELKSERNRLAALYVNPWIEAADDLQSRIYNLISRNGLAPLRQRFPDGKYAMETLYLLARYLGWQRVNFRYGPYARDPLVISMREAIVDIIAKDGSAIGGVGSFCFFRPEQAVLADLAVVRSPGHASEFDSVPMIDFATKITSIPLSSAVDETLNDLKSAASPDQIKSRKRLAHLQARLVDLLEYLEKGEGFRLHSYERNRSTPE